jgi:hypothetical protein
MQEGEMTFSLSGSAGVFYLAPAPGFAEPSIGEELWLSMPSFKAFVLRKAERGEVLRAGIASLDVPPVPAELRADFSRGLGVDVTAEPSCTYEPGVELHDAVFAVDPPVRVRSGSSQRVALAGSDYDVSLYAQGNYWALSIVATPPR